MLNVKKREEKGKETKGGNGGNDETKRNLALDLLPINLLFHVLHVLSFSYPDEISEILFEGSG